MKDNLNLEEIKKEIGILYVTISRYKQKQRKLIAKNKENNKEKEECNADHK